MVGGKIPGQRRVLPEARDQRRYATAKLIHFKRMQGRICSRKSESLWFAENLLSCF
jgi:hypothetical protein